MPQMAPILWLYLYMIFSFIYLIFCSINFYSFKSNNSLLNNKINLNILNFSKFNWKW